MKILLSMLLSLLFIQSITANEKLIFLRDPFNPNPIENNPQTKTYSERTFKITGIIWDKNNPSAVIQFPRFKKIVYIGNTINKYEITKITKKHIELSNSSRKIMVKLGEEKIFEW